MADYEDTKVTDLVINNMSQEKFEELKAAGELDPTQIYLTPTEGSGGVSLPDQAGNAGKFLQTDGTTAIWSPNIVLEPSKTGVGLDVTTSSVGAASCAFGSKTEATGFGATAIGNSAKASARKSVAIGTGNTANAEFAIQIGSKDSGISYGYTNSDANTFKVGNANGNFEIMSADGTIPTDRYSITPTGAGTYVPKLTIAEDGTVTREWGAESGGAGGDYLPLSGGTLTGGLEFEWSGNYQSTKNIILKTKYHRLDNDDIINTDVMTVNPNGEMFFGGTVYSKGFRPVEIDRSEDLGTTYYCFGKTFTQKINAGRQNNVDSGDLIVPTEGGTLARLEDLEGLGGVSLPDQTDNAGKFLTTDGVTTSWGKAVVNNSTLPQNLAIGDATDIDGVSYGTAVGYGCKIKNSDFLPACAFGSGQIAAAKGAIQIGVGASWISSVTNQDPNTFKVSTTVGNFEMMDANGNVPRERLKNLVAVLPTADNGYTTVKNFGNGYVEITGYASIGTVGASTGSEVQIDLPAGYTMADAKYWVNIAPTSETTMFDFKAEAKARSTTHFMVAYKNEDTTTGLTAAGVYWEVRGMLATE